MWLDYYQGMSLIDDPHQAELRAAGWRSRGYLPHFDGRPVVQFVTLHLADSIPREVIQRWQRELKRRDYEDRKQILQLRVERFLDQGYGKSYLKHAQVAKMVQAALLNFNNVRYRLFSWVVMPNHVHFLLKRADGQVYREQSCESAFVYGAGGLAL